MRNRSVRRCCLLIFLFLIGSTVAVTKPQSFLPKRFRNEKVVEVEVVEVKNSISQKHAIAAGLVLAFNAGYSNGCCLAGSIVEGTKQAVAAMTGSWTNSAIGLATKNAALFKMQVSMILCYCGGSVIAGLLNPTPKPYVLAPSTGGALLLCSALMYMSTLMAIADGSQAAIAIFSLAAIANGIQNSITSVHSANLIRSTHYTGMTSDMGTFIGQCLRGNMTNVFRLKVSMGLAACFFAGGFASVACVKAFGTASLLLSAAIYAACGLVALAWAK